MLVGILSIGYIWYTKQYKRREITELISLRELPAGFVSHGIDISRYQKKIDWDTFFADTDSRVRFVYCKATEGVSHVDAYWKVNRAALEAHGMANGAYHFFLPKANAELQAHHFLNHYTPKQGDLPPVLDVETKGKTDARLISSMNTWLTIVEQKTGKRPIIYTSYNFYNTKFKGKFKGYKFWVANYSYYPERFNDDEIIHWQYSDHGKVPGIEGPVDLNFSKVDF